MTATTQYPTEPFRVISVGCSWRRPILNYGADGPELGYAPEVAIRGQVIDLTADEAGRLTALGAVVPKDAPLTVNEMTDDEIAALAPGGLEALRPGVNVPLDDERPALAVPNVHDPIGDARLAALERQRRPVTPALAPNPGSHR